MSICIHCHPSFSPRCMCFVLNFILIFITFTFGPFVYLYTFWNVNSEMWIVCNFSFSTNRWCNSLKSKVIIEFCFWIVDNFANNFFISFYFQDFCLFYFVLFCCVFQLFCGNCKVSCIHALNHNTIIFVHTDDIKASINGQYSSITHLMMLITRFCRKNVRSDMRTSKHYSCDFRVFT